MQFTLPSKIALSGKGGKCVTGFCGIWLAKNIIFTPVPHCPVILMGLGTKPPPN